MIGQSIVKSPCSCGICNKILKKGEAVICERSGYYMKYYCLGCIKEIIKDVEGGIKNV